MSGLEAVAGRLVIEVPMASCRAIGCTRPDKIEGLQADCSTESQQGADNGVWA